MGNKPSPAIILIDLETTGLDCKQHEIVDTCAIILSRRLQKINEFHVLSHPDHPDTAEERALEINGYDYDTWQSNGAVTQKELAHMFSDFITNTVGDRSIRLIPAGHRVAFDVGFISALMDRFDIEVSIDNRRLIDTLVLEDCIRVARSIGEGRSTRPSAKSFEGLARKYNINMGSEYHTARGDTHATLEVLRRQIKLISTGVTRTPRKRRKK
jgi:DNA polymerase III epsilon subunit-like protein